jgi:transcriptional regulator with XRE-family HTH domain
VAEHLHQQLRRIRRQRCIKQVDLAVRVGIAPESLTRIERGVKDPRESSLEAIAHSLEAELLVIPRTHVPEVLKLIGLAPSVSDPSVGSTFDDIFIPDPADEDV